MMYKIKIYKNEKLEQFDNKNDVLMAEQSFLVGRGFTLEDIKGMLYGETDRLINQIRKEAI